MGNAIINSMAQGRDDNGNYNLNLDSAFADLSSQEEVDEYKNLTSS